jgi:DNA-binding response OmpR family regulator
MKILLIDDNERLVTIYQSIIEKEGYESKIELDSSKAIVTIRAENPDLILLDIMMEPLTGWEVLDQIRNEADLSDIPVIILTGKIMTLNEAILYGMKIDGFVMKPLERSMLVTSIKEVAEILSECKARYNKAISTGLSEDKAIECQRMMRKRKILTYLKELLVRQERIVSLRPEEESDMNGAIEELRKIIEGKFQEYAKAEVICP